VTLKFEDSTNKVTGSWHANEFTTFRLWSSLY
jgi:hypothetical protein